MKYLNDSFSVTLGDSEEYRDNYDRIFRKAGWCWKSRIPIKTYESHEPCDVGKKQSATKCGECDFLKRMMNKGIAKNGIK
jgi:hypothetical protein